MFKKNEMHLRVFTVACNERVLIDKNYFKKNTILKPESVNYVLGMVLY